MKKMIIRKIITAAAVAAAVVFSACETVYDYEGDCSVSYRVKFRYDKNLKWADAFANEVKSVRLYAFDQSGALVYDHAVSGESLAKPDFAINLDLEPGKYHLVAWCGLDNPDAAEQHFEVPTVRRSATMLEDIKCRLIREADEVYPAVSDKRLEFMFHGDMDVELPEDNDGGEYVYTMSLTKDTNHIRVILQHLSGNDVDVDKFAFRIEENNGYYAHDNTLLDDEKITYKTFKTSSGEASIVRPDDNTRAVVRAKTAIADLSVARMMADRKQDMRLTVTNDKGTDIAYIPVIEYVLLAKDYYEEAYGHLMTDQQFLDREDEYVMTLFLDENQEWSSAEILINEWRVVLHDYGVGK